MIKSNIPPVLVLAGGKATRLSGIAADTPKYLMPINSNQVFADIHLSWLKNKGFEKVILSVGHLGHKIQNYCGDGAKWGLRIDYLDDGNLPLGTGGAVQGALQFEFDEICITYGDTLLDFSVDDFIRNFHSHLHKDQALGAMTIYKNNLTGHLCNIKLDSPWAIYDKQKAQKEWVHIDYGFMVLRREMVQSFTETLPFDLARPLERASQEKRIIGFLVNERFWEIGSPDALREFQLLFGSNTIF
jgi:NDP-sugar pyrophosphorylase family protein